MTQIIINNFPQKINFDLSFICRVRWTIFEGLKWICYIHQNAHYIVDYLSHANEFTRNNFIVEYFSFSNHFLSFIFSLPLSFDERNNRATTKFISDNNNNNNYILQWSPTDSWLVFYALPFHGPIKFVIIMQITCICWTNRLTNTVGGKICKFTEIIIATTTLSAITTKSHAGKRSGKSISTSIYTFVQEFSITIKQWSQ